MNPLDRFDPEVDTPESFIARLREKQRDREREIERRDAIRRNQAIAKIKQQEAVEAARKPKNVSPPFVGSQRQRIAPPSGSGSTVTPPTSPSGSDPFGLDTLRYHLAEAKKENQKFRSAVDAVLAIHIKVEDKREGRDFYCGHCSTAYPCVTVEALLGDDE